MLLTKLSPFLIKQINDFFDENSAKNPEICAAYLQENLWQLRSNQEFYAFISKKSEEFLDNILSLETIDPKIFTKIVQKTFSKEMRTKTKEEVITCKVLKCLDELLEKEDYKTIEDCCYQQYLSFYDKKLVDENYTQGKEQDTRRKTFALWPYHKAQELEKIGELEKAFQLMGIQCDLIGSFAKSNKDHAVDYDVYQNIYARDYQTHLQDQMIILDHLHKFKENITTSKKSPGQSGINPAPN